MNPLIFECLGTIGILRLHRLGVATKHLCVTKRADRVIGLATANKRELFDFAAHG